MRIAVFGTGGMVGPHTLALPLQSGVEAPSQLAKIRERVAAHYRAPGTRHSTTALAAPRHWNDDQVYFPGIFTMTSGRAGGSP